MYVRVCTCVCERERERVCERESRESRERAVDARFIAGETERQGRERRRGER